jgi:hypothetical protein
MRVEYYAQLERGALAGVSAGVRLRLSPRPPGRDLASSTTFRRARSLAIALLTERLRQACTRWSGSVLSDFARPVKLRAAQAQRFRGLVHPVQHGRNCKPSL